MANPFFVQPAQYGQALGGLAGSVQQFGQQRQEEQRRQEAEAYKQEAKQAMATAFQSGDPMAIRQAVIQYPEIAETATQMFGFTNEQTEQVARETYRRALSETDPARRAAIMEGGIETVRQFGGNPRNMASDLEMLRTNPEAFDRSARAGYAALASDQEFEAMFGGQAQDPTAFMQEMAAAGVLPGSQEYKDAVLERYGKGQTIGFDVVEAINPDSGKREYYQVSRTDPGNRIPLGLEVPQDPRVQAQLAETARAETQAAQQEQKTIAGTLSTINKIITSPGLSGFSGLDSFRRLIPGTEAANVAAYIEQLQSQNFLTAVDQMKGMGALSENEGKKLSASVAALSPSMTDEAIKAELDSIQTQLASALERLNSGALAEPRAQQQETVNWSDL